MKNTIKQLFENIHQLVINEGGDGSGAIIFKGINPDFNYKDIAKQFEIWQKENKNDWWKNKIENNFGITYYNDNENIVISDDEHNNDYKDFRFIIR